MAASSPNLLVSAQRQLLPFEHVELRRHIDTINKLGDLGIKWRQFGEAGITYVERGVYGRAQKATGRLATVGAVNIAKELGETVIPAMPGAAERITARISDIFFYGDGPFSSIAYTLDNPKLLEEQARLTAWLDHRNGVNSEWGEFDPHFSVATVNRRNETDEILDAFWNISPETATFMPLIAKAS